MKNTAGEPRRNRWWRRGNRGPGRTQRAGASGQTAAEPVQLAIGLLTASLDSAELQAWAVRALPLDDPAALGDLLAGLHLISQLLLHQLHEATGQPPATTLQALAIAAETRGDRPSGGQSSAGWPAA